MQRDILATIKKTLHKHEKDYDCKSLWREPLVEIISANDNKLQSLKKIVSPEHLTPHDILPDAQSIISFFIPFRQHIVKSNIHNAMSSEEWAMAYVKTNDLIKAINDAIEIFMGAHGYTTGKIPATHNFDVQKLLSNWSHRHIAYFAGLGTFGINNMLITKNGCCGRVGSIIINYACSEYTKIEEIEEKCLHKKNGTCGICQKQCVAGVYENAHFDRAKCYRQCLINAEYHNKNKKVGYVDTCGKCCVGLPCSMQEP